MDKFEYAKQIANYWQTKFKSKPVPRRIRAVKSDCFEELRARIGAQDLAYAQNFIDSIYDGDLHVMKNAFPKDFLTTLIGRLHTYGKAVPQKSFAILTGTPDSHMMIKEYTGPRDGYVALDHSYYFFRWNDDPLELFKAGQQNWQVMKTLSGRRPDEFEKNLPKDRAIDRIQAIHYPRGAGFISKHMDPFEYQRFVWGAEMTQMGQDFSTGGFFVYEKNKTKRYVEKEVELGSVVVFFPGIVHGVDIVDEGSDVDWNSTSGRWYLTFNTVDSHEFKDRLSALPPPEDFG